MYEDFVCAYQPVLTRWRRRRRDHDAAAFADYVQVLTHWRRLPYLDPGLAPELLPADWRGSQAADIFFELHERLAPASHRHFAAVAGLQSASTA
jgi:phenylacetic acid degradation operon negative regulatory protein